MIVFALNALVVREANPLSPARIGQAQTETVVLFDLSVSMTAFTVGIAFDDWIGELRRAVQELDGELGPSDVVAVGSFADRIAIGSRSGPSSGSLTDVLESVTQLGSASPISDAVWQAIDRLEASPVPVRRRAVIVVTDGFNAGNRRSAAEVQRRAASAGIRVDAIWTSRSEFQRAPAAVITRAKKYLDTLVQGTGGRITECSRRGTNVDCKHGEDRLGGILTRILREVQSGAPPGR
jgi:hypothetical protein